MKYALCKALGLAGILVASTPAALAGDTEAAALATPASIAVVDRETGKLRAPTAQEREALAAGFRDSLEKLVGKKALRAPASATRHDDGSASAVVGLSRMQFLVAEVDDEGNVVLGHADVDEDGRIAPVSHQHRAEK